MNSIYQKSCVELYNNNSTEIDPTTTGGVPVAFGNTQTKTGVSIAPQLNGVQILSSGLYEFAFDASFTNGAAAGLLEAQLYKDGVPVASASASDGLAATEDGNLSFTTRLKVSACCATQPTFTVVLTGTSTAVTLTHVAFGVIKQA